MEVVLNVALYTALVPGGVAVLAALTMRFLRAESASRAVVAAFGVAIGAVAAHAGINGFPPILPPSGADSIHWIPFVTVGSLLLLIPWEGSRGLAPLGWLVAGAAGAAGAYFVGKPTFAQASVGALSLGVGAVGFAVAVVTASVDAATRRMPAWGAYLAMLLSVTAASVGCVLAANAKVGMLLGGVAGALGGLAFGGLVFKSTAGSRAAIGVVAATVAMLLLYLKMYGGSAVWQGIETVPLALLGASFLAPGFASLAPLSPKLRVALALFLAAALGAGGAFLAEKKAAPASSGGDYVGMLLR